EGEPEWPISCLPSLELVFLPGAPGELVHALVDAQELHRGVEERNGEEAGEEGGVDESRQDHACAVPLYRLDDPGDDVLRIHDREQQREARLHTGEHARRDVERTDDGRPYVAPLAPELETQRLVEADRRVLARAGRDGVSIGEVALVAGRRAARARDLAAHRIGSGAVHVPEDELPALGCDRERHEPPEAARRSRHENLSSGVVAHGVPSLRVERRWYTTSLVTRAGVIAPVRLAFHPTTPTDDVRGIVARVRRSPAGVLTATFSL